MPDGVFVEGTGGMPVFVPVPALTDDDVRRIAETTAHRVVNLLERRGLLEPDAPPDVLVQEEPLLAALTAASIRGTVAIGERAGKRVRRRLIDPQEGIQSGPLCFSSRGFSLHAATRVEAGERETLERLCRYVLRPPLAAGRLQVVHEPFILPIRFFLSVFDALGRRVRIITDAMHAPGRYEARFDGDGLPSGWYVYRLEIGSTQVSGTMLLLR
jgi:hypothetical protein